MFTTCPATDISLSFSSAIIAARSRTQNRVFNKGQQPAKLAGYSP